MHYGRGFPALLAFAAVALLTLAAPRSLKAGEITLFWSRNGPHQTSAAPLDATVTWRDGQGANLAMGLVKVAQVEVEGARALDSRSELRMTYFTASGVLKMPFTRITPFVGLGVGLYHQSLGSTWKINTHEAAFAGVKARLADLVVLRAEYRRFRLHGAPYGDLDSRIALGAGIAF